MTKRSKPKNKYKPYEVVALSLAFIVIAGISLSSYVNAPTKLFNREKVVNMLFVGDMMFDRGVANHVDKYGIDSLTKGVRSLLNDNDMTIGNLEGTITTKPSVARPNNNILHFTFDPKFAALLKSLDFTAVSLANNHSSDFYASGFNETKKHLDENGIFSFGSANNDVSISTAIKKDSENICFIGYHDLYTYDETPAVSEIRKMRPNCTFIVVFAHWGVEYDHVQSERQMMLAHEFVNAGADLIIGAHPHVVQPVEIYDGKAIFYSLGNFIFDQEFSWGVKHGLAVNVGLGEKEVSFHLTPVAINRAEANIATSTDIEKVMDIAGKPMDFALKR